MPRTGEIIVSAVIDEVEGLEQALSSVEEWLTDKTRFDGEWIKAVRETIAAAQDRINNLKKPQPPT